MTLDPPLALLLGVAGGVLQYAMRQFQNVQERWYHLAAVGLCFGLYVLVTPGWADGPWRESTVRAIVWLAERVPSIWGGSFIVSGAAKAVTNRWPATAGSVLVPSTDSK